MSRPDGAADRWPRRQGTAVLRALVALALLAGASYGIWGALREGGNTTRQLLARDGAAAWLGGSLLVNLVGLALGMLAWRGILAGLGSSLPWGPTFRIFGATVLGRYLPGGVWSAAVGVHLGRHNGLTASRMLGTYALNSVVALLTAALVGTIAGPAVLDGEHGRPWMVPLAVALAVALAVLLWRPAAVVRAVVAGARRLRQTIPEVQPAQGPLRTAVILQILSWMVGGTHLWMIAVVLNAPPARSLALCVGGFALAVAAGAATFVAPGGAGVREVVLMVLLTQRLPWSHAGAAVLASRVCCTVTEVVGAALIMVASRWMADHSGSGSRFPARCGEVGSARSGET